MSEVEKLYSLANIDWYDRYYSCKDNKEGDCNGNCELCDDSIEVKCYPPFTAEKQLELIKWLMAKAKDYQYDVKNGKYWFIIDDYRETKYRDFDEALAELITLYWQDLTEQDLTEQDRTEIADILRG